jgi:hypothetical protein
MREHGERVRPPRPRQFGAAGVPDPAEQVARGDGVEGFQRVAAGLGVERVAQRGFAGSTVSLVEKRLRPEAMPERGVLRLSASARSSVRAAASGSRADSCASASARYRIGRVEISPPDLVSRSARWYASAAAP